MDQMTKLIWQAEDINLQSSSGLIPRLSQAHGAPSPTLHHQAETTGLHRAHGTILHAGAGGIPKCLMCRST